MFYSQLILAKKGPLGKIWLAAHFAKRISKAHVVSTNVEKSVEYIMFPTEPLSLRVSGHLLLGIVRIYSQKCEYLMNDCREALIKIKLAFRSADVDLPVHDQIASSHAINAVGFNASFTSFNDGSLEFVDDQGTMLAGMEFLEQEWQPVVHQAAPRDITLPSSYSRTPLGRHSVNGIDFNDGESILGSVSKRSGGFAGDMGTLGGTNSGSFLSVSDVETGRDGGGDENARQLFFGETNHLDSIPMDSSFTTNGRQSLGPNMLSPSRVGTYDDGFDAEVQGFGIEQTLDAYDDSTNATTGALRVQFEQFAFARSEEEAKKPDVKPTIKRRKLNKGQRDKRTELSDSALERQKREVDKLHVDRGPPDVLDYPPVHLETAAGYKRRLSRITDIALYASKRRRQHFDPHEMLSRAAFAPPSTVPGEIAAMFRLLSNIEGLHQLARSNALPLEGMDDSSAYGDVEVGRGDGDGVGGDFFDENGNVSSGMTGWPNHSRLSLDGNGVSVMEIQNGHDDSVDVETLSEDDIDEAASRRSSNKMNRPDIRAHVLEPRMKTMISDLRLTKKPIAFNQAIFGSSRNVAAKCFFDLLVLKTRNEIRINQEQQPGGYGPITVSLA
eukprot:Stramenopile-MAST_4_protein_250